MKEIPLFKKPLYAQFSWLTVLRILLGAIILFKSIKFLYDTAFLKSQIETTGIETFSQHSNALSFVIAYVSLICGLFIVIGLFTRLACIIQIPILFVAIFFVNFKNIDYDIFEFILSDITLVLLFVFALKGGGTLSADEYFRRGITRHSRSLKH